ncbi:MAG: hypothetical protein M1343_08360 [Chloroflexi bacterium]|nr:hypothetical protein [Chloroflexota bacterium]
MDIRYEFNKRRDNFWLWLAKRMPKRFVMWCAIRLIGYATSGKYGNTEVPKLTAMDAVQRWEMA